MRGTTCGRAIRSIEFCHGRKKRLVFEHQHSEVLDSSMRRGYFDRMNEEGALIGYIDSM